MRSRANACLKRVRAVRTGRERALLLEGERLVRDALTAGHRLELLLVGEEREELARELAGRAQEVRLVQGDLLAAVSALTTPPGVVALAKRPAARRLEELEPNERTLLLVVAGIADPGNLGALARSAEAAGAQALVVLDGGARPWGEKALRGSMGSLLRLPVVEEGEAAQVAARLAERGFRQVVAATRDGAPPADLDRPGPLALWVGGETGALPVEAEALEPVTIPMAGAVESLNVTVAASLLLFAAGRNR